MNSFRLSQVFTIFGIVTNAFVVVKERQNTLILMRESVVSPDEVIGAQCGNEIELSTRVVESIEKSEGPPLLTKQFDYDAPLTTLGGRRSRLKRSGAQLNGWIPDIESFCYGLPGASAPLGNFDPLQFSENASLQQVQRYREAEITHCRLAMLAILGWLAAEAISPLLSDGKVNGPAHLHIINVPGPLLAALTIPIGIAETYRARRGWVEPADNADPFEMKATYYPGDIGFDPAGFKPQDPADFAIMQAKELNNGRLACIAWIGILVQELTTQETVAETFHSLFSS
mmetsp:Transcript_4240/g.5981  ORF Transcript_4240/g.5981 Transcript_4240/m.5981 type:complete len:286 (-) Transcript_4240:2073-2930(-)